MLLFYNIEQGSIEYGVTSNEVIKYIKKLFRTKMKKQIKPNFFIMGPAAGSTSMYYYLNQHPEIFMSEVKEPLYFRKDLVLRGNLKNKYGTKDMYYKLFEKAKKEKIIGEATPTYIYSDTAIKEIKKEIGKPKILIMLRKPISFISLSHHYAYINGYESIKDLGKALDAEKVRMKGRRSPQIVSEREMVYYIYLLKKIYRNVEKCMKTFGKNNVKVVLQEELKENPKKVYRKILKFLEVDPLFTPSFKMYNISKATRNRFLMKTIRKSEELPTPTIKVLKIIFPKKARNFIRNANVKTHLRKPTNLGIAKRVKKEFNKDVLKLGKVIKKDLEHWSR